MQFKGTCIAVEDSSYQSKRSGRVGQMTLTCLDADTVLRLKDTVDVVLPQEEFERIKERPIDKTFEFQVIEIRPGRGPRFRFDARLMAPKEFSMMEAPEVHILIQQSWQLFGTFTFKDDVMSTARRFSMFFAWLRQSARQFGMYFPDLPWCLRMEDGELTARRHFHFLLAGLPARCIHLTTCYWMAHKWEELGGGMARIRQFNPALTGVGYITKCLSGPDGGDLYEFDKFGLKCCELTLSKALLRNAKRACDRRRRC